jgi:hypothetical protein
MEAITRNNPPMHQKSCPLIRALLVQHSPVKVLRKNISIIAITFQRPFSPDVSNLNLLLVSRPQYSDYTANARTACIRPSIVWKPNKLGNAHNVTVLPLYISHFLQIFHLWMLTSNAINGVRSEHFGQYGDHDNRSENPSSWLHSRHTQTCIFRLRVQTDWVHPASCCTTTRSSLPTGKAAGLRSLSLISIASEVWMTGIIPPRPQSPWPALCLIKDSDNFVLPISYSLYQECRQQEQTSVRYSTIRTHHLPSSATSTAPILIQLQTLTRISTRIYCTEFD